MNSNASLGKSESTRQVSKSHEKSKLSADNSCLPFVCICCPVLAVGQLAQTCFVTSLENEENLSWVLWLIARKRHVIRLATPKTENWFVNNLPYITRPKSLQCTMHFANKIHIGNEKCLMDQYMSGQWSLYNKRKQEHPVNVPTFQAYCRCFYVWILGTLRLNLWTYRSKLTLVDWLLLYPDHCLKIKKNDRVNKDINIYVKIIFFMFYYFLLCPTGVEKLNIYTYDCTN